MGALQSGFGACAQHPLEPGSGSAISRTVRGYEPETVREGGRVLPRRPFLILFTRPTFGMQTPPRAGSSAGTAVCVRRPAPAPRPKRKRHAPLIHAHGARPQMSSTA
eukprot:1114211-Prymnesium_polylepis.2